MGHVMKLSGNLRKITSIPILEYADFKKPFKLHMDECMLGLGAILYQNQNGMDRVIGYGSQTFRKVECKYLLHKLQFLVLKWAVN